MNSALKLLALAILSIFMLATSVSYAAPAQHVTVIATVPDGLFFESGESVKSDMILELIDGQKVVLANNAGHIHEISGPYKGQIDDAIPVLEVTTRGQDILSTIRAFLSQKSGSNNIPGATRSGGNSVWDLVVIEPSGSITHCIQDFQRFNVVVATDHSASDMKVELTSPGLPSSVSWVLPGSKQVSFDTSRFFEGDYTVSVDDVSATRIRFVKIPEVEDFALTRAFYDAGCRIQFERSLDLAKF